MQNEQYFEKTKPSDAGRKNMMASNPGSKYVQPK